MTDCIQFVFNKKMVFHGLGNYSSSLIFCAMKMVVSKDHRSPSALTVVKQHVM